MPRRLEFLSVLLAVAQSVSGHTQPPARSHSAIREVVLSSHRTEAIQQEAAVGE